MIVGMAATLFLVLLCNLFQGVMEQVQWQPQLPCHVQLHHQLHQKLSHQLEGGFIEVVEQVSVIWVRDTI